MLFAKSDASKLDRALNRLERLDLDASNDFRNRLMMERKSESWYGSPECEKFLNDIKDVISSYNRVPKPIGLFLFW